MKEINIANSIFNGFNDKHCLMLCGYEWGSPKAGEALGEDIPAKTGVPHVFSNKALEYGEVAKTWPYDNKILKWFALWGHPLNQEGTGGNFEKCLVQTNWCDSQNHHIDGSYDEKLLAPEQVDNFIAHVQALQPRIILFLGSRILPILQHESVLSRFEAVVGQKLGAPTFISKPFSGRCFNVGFQDFEFTRVVCLPHPSGTHGLSNDYIALFSDEIGSIIRDYKASRAFSP